MREVLEMAETGLESTALAGFPFDLAVALAEQAGRWVGVMPG